MGADKFEGKRWVIVYGSYRGVEGYAVDELYKLVQKYVPYTLTVKKDEIESMEIEEYNTVYIGTTRSNRYINKFVKEGLIQNAACKEGYAIKVCKYPSDSQRQMIIIAGADESGVLYGVRDFDHHYVSLLFSTRVYRFTGIGNKLIFMDDLEDLESYNSPAIENRGLWTWGHVIYDYKKYLDNMSIWKMNIVIIWNDFVPLNAKKIVEYAHSRGIKVIWGFSWCWGEEVNPTDPNELEKWTEKVLHVYETQYAGTGADGIYFQTFTETKETKMYDLPIAELVTNWVNYITGRLLENYPDLWIQFGLHATSIGNNAAIAKVDSRINITWEDCGSFPFSYLASDVENFDETLRYVSWISELRSKNEDFGAVLKGCTTLDWSRFEKQKGTFVLGETKDDFIKSRAYEKMSFWKYIQAYWLKNLACVIDTVKLIQSKDIRKKTLTLLVEDGLWEEHMWGPVALFAEILWNPDEDCNEIIRKVSLASDAYFV